MGMGRIGWVRDVAFWFLLVSMLVMRLQQLGCRLFFYTKPHRPAPWRAAAAVAACKAHSSPTYIIMSSAAASSSSSAAGGAAAAPAAKRKTTNDDDSALPPDKAKNASLQRLVKQLNATIKAKKDQYTIVQLNDSPLRLIPGREDKILDEYEVECLSDLSSDQLNAIYNKLTQEEVDNYLHLMVVRESTVNLFEKQIKSIQVRFL